MKTEQKTPAFPQLPHDARQKMIEYARQVGKKEFDRHGPLK